MKKCSVFIFKTAQTLDEKYHQNQKYHGREREMRHSERAKFKK